MSPADSNAQSVIREELQTLTIVLSWVKPGLFLFSYLFTNKWQVKYRLNWDIIAPFHSFFKWAMPSSFNLFSSFQTNITIFTTNSICDKCPSSIWCQDSNLTRNYFPKWNRNLHFYNTQKRLHDCNSDELFSSCYKLLINIK